MIVDKDGNKVGKENIREVILRMDTSSRNQTDDSAVKNISVPLNKTVEVPVNVIKTAYPGNSL